MPRLTVLALFACVVGGAREFVNDPVLVVGACGRTGSRVYKLLQKTRAVSAIVLNATEAREILGCKKCDKSEGIYVADVTVPATLIEPVSSAGSIVIATAPQVDGCDPYPQNCTCPKGECPIDVDWHGGKNIITAFAKARHGVGQVVMVSSDNTINPTGPVPGKDPTTDPLNGFYKLLCEAFLMNSGLAYTIIKPCGLTNAPPALAALDTFHDDSKTTGHGTISRNDIARLIDVALTHPEVSNGLRFDFCSKPGPPTPDSGLISVLKSARYKW